MSLWATKSITALRAEADAAGEGSLKRALGPLNLITLGIGAIIGAGIFVLTGQAAALHAGPAVPLSMIAGGHRLRLRRPVLRRDGERRSDRRQRVHLLLRHHGRAGRLDHRLGPGARVRRGRRDGRGRLVRPLRVSLLGLFGIHIPAALAIFADRSGARLARSARWPRRDARMRAQPDRRDHQPAGRVHRGDHVHDPGDRHQGIGARSTTSS